MGWVVLILSDSGASSWRTYGDITYIIIGPGSSVCVQPKIEVILKKIQLNGQKLTYKFTPPPLADR